MSYCKRYTVTATTDGSGDATVYTPTVNGRILNVIYTKTDYADGVDFTITLEDTGIGLWTESNVNASATRSPHQLTHSQVGAELDYAAGGSKVETDIWAADERVKIVVANGGATKVGVFDVIVG